MAMFTDTITVYNKVSDTEWKRTVVKGVQWADKTEKKIVDGVLRVVRYASVTFPQGTYEGLVLDSAKEEDIIVCGCVTDVVNNIRSSRLSDILEKYPKSGRIKAVNDNSRRTMLSNIKVVVE